MSRFAASDSIHASEQRHAHGRQRGPDMAHCCLSQAELSFMRQLADLASSSTPGAGAGAAAAAEKQQRRQVRERAVKVALRYRFTCRFLGNALCLGNRSSRPSGTSSKSCTMWSSPPSGHQHNSAGHSLPASTPVSSSSSKRIQGSARCSWTAAGSSTACAAFMVPDSFKRYDKGHTPH